MDLQNSIPISKIPLLQLNPEKLCDVKDLEILQYSLQYHLLSINEEKFKEFNNFPTDYIFSQLNEINVDLVCNILQIVIRIDEDKNENIKHILRKTILLENNFIQLKLYYALIDVCIDYKIEGAVINVNFLNSLIVKQVEKETKTFEFFIYKLLPKCFQIFDADDILNILWQQITSSRNLNYLCVLPMQFFKSKNFNPLKYDSYWLILQDYLIQNYGLKYKTGMYLLQISLNELKNYNSFKTDNSIISFNEETKLGYIEEMGNLCMLVDISQEKQLHLIKPVLSLFNSMTNLHESWLNLVYKLYLNHPHDDVLQTSIALLLESNCDVTRVGKYVLNALHKISGSTSKIMFKELNTYSINLSATDYEILLKETLNICWTPIGSWYLYKNIICNHYISLDIIRKIIQKIKNLPHKYIRKGCIDIILKKINLQLEQFMNNDLNNLINLLLDLIKEDGLKKYVITIINAKQFVINKELLNVIKDWLNEDIFIVDKINLLVDIVNQGAVEKLWVEKTILVPFIKRNLSCGILDALTNVYYLKASDLEDYLLWRLDSNEEAHNICHTDKISSRLIDKCKKILLGNYCENQQVLAFEISFYASDSKFNAVYKHWISKIVSGEPLSSKLAYGFIKLVQKISSKFISKFATVEDIINVFNIFLQTQTSDVIVQVFHKIDLILEEIKENHLYLIENCFQELNAMRKFECFEITMRYFVRNIKACYFTMNKEVLNVILRKLYSFSENCPTTAYYTILYLKYLNVPVEIMPFYNYLSIGDVLTKEIRSEYEICKCIYLESHSPNPYFRVAEIHKWVVEDMMYDLKSDRINKITEELLENYKKHFDKRYFPDSHIHLNKLRIMQTLCFCIEKIDNKRKSQLLTLLTESFCIESHQSSVRQLMQYLLVVLLKNDPNCLDYFKKTIDSVSKTHTSTITGFLPVMYGVEMHKNSVEFTTDLIRTVVQWTMGPHFKLRFYTQLLIKKIYERNFSKRLIKNQFEIIYKTIKTVVDSTNVIEEAGEDFALIEILFRKLINHKSQVYIITTYIPEKNGVTNLEWEYYKIKNAWSKYVKENLEVKEIKLNLSLESNPVIQKKITPYKEMSYLSSNTKNKLILVANLIDSPANLGGLSRTCEIFGVKEMILHSINVVNNKEFQGLSMSSEKWLDIKEVKRDHLIQFILKYKQEGYRVVGAEQTNEGVSLNNYIFEEKTLLLLGNEKTGIPPNLISLLDDAVEIPQFGTVRSLNVHVSGALFIWEFTKQSM